MNWKNQKEEGKTNLLCTPLLRVSTFLGVSSGKKCLGGCFSFSCNPDWFIFNPLGPSLFLTIKKEKNDLTMCPLNFNFF